MQNEYDELLAKGPAVGNEYDEVLRSQATGQSNLAISAKAAATVNPDQAAKVIKLSDRNKLPTDVVSRNVEEVEKQDRVREINEFDKLLSNPKVREWLAEQDNLAVAQDDLENLGVFQWMLEAPRRAFGQGTAQVKLGHLRYRSIFGELTAEENERLKNLRADMRAGGELGAEAFPARALTGAARQLPQLFGSIYAGSQYGLTGAVAGGTAATIAGQLGPQIALPEEVVTVPGAAAMGYYAGHTVGSAQFGMEQEAGHAYDEFLEFKDENGQKLDPTVAKVAALAAGGINAGLEAAQLNILMRTIPGLDKLVGAPGREAVRAALKMPTVRNAFLSFAKTYGTVLAKESAIEMAQRAVTVMMGELAKTTGDFEHITPKEFAQELVSEGKSALEAFTLLSLPGPSVNLALDIRQAKQAKVNAEFFKSLGETAEKSKLRERLPERLQDLAQRLTQDGPVENVYIEPKAFVEYFQSKNLDPREVMTELTGNAETLEQALQSGHDLQIPTAAYAAKLAGTEHNRFFIDELKFDPTGINAREAKELEKVAQEEITKLQEELQKQEEGGVAPTVAGYVAQQLEAAGYERSTAETMSQQMGAFFDTMAERSQQEGQPKRTGWDLFKDYAIRVLGKGMQPFQKPMTEMEQGKPVKEKQPLKFSLFRDAFRRVQEQESSQLPAVVPEPGQAPPVQGPRMTRRQFLETARSAATMQTPLGRMAGAVAKMFGPEAVKELAGQATDSIVREVVRSLVQQSKPSFDFTDTGIFSFGSQYLDDLASKLPVRDTDTREDFLADNPKLAKKLLKAGLIEFRDSGDDSVLTESVDEQIEIFQEEFDGGVYWSYTEGTTAKDVSKILSEGQATVDHRMLPDGTAFWRTVDHDGKRFVEITASSYMDGPEGALYVTRAVTAVLNEAATDGVQSVFINQELPHLDDLMKNMGIEKSEDFIEFYEVPTGDFKFTQLELEQSAWHGSGAVFEKFDISKIGTGEGAQVHGWGLYFAKIKQTAEGYKRRHGRRTLEGLQEMGYGDNIPSVLEDNNWLDAIGRAKTTAERKELVADKLRRMKTKLHASEQRLSNEMKLAGIPVGDGRPNQFKVPPSVERALNAVDFLQEGVQILERLAQRDDVKIANAGRLYEVNILAEDNEMLDLEKGLPNWEQPWGQTAMGQIRAKYDEAWNEAFYEAQGLDGPHEYLGITNITALLERVDEGKPISEAQRRMVDAWQEIERNQTTTDLVREYEAKIKEWTEEFPDLANQFAQFDAYELWGVMVSDEDYFRGADRYGIKGMSEARYNEAKAWLAKFSARWDERQRLIEQTLYPNDLQNPVVWQLLQTKEMQDLMVQHDIDNGRDLYRAIVRELKNPRYQSMNRASASQQARSAQDAIAGHRIKEITYEEADDNGQFYVNVMGGSGVDPTYGYVNIWHGKLDINDLRYLFPPEISFRMLNLEGRVEKDGDDIIAYTLEPGTPAFRTAWRDPGPDTRRNIERAVKLLQGKHVDDLIYDHVDAVGVLNEHIYTVKATGPNGQVIYDEMLDEDSILHIFGNEIRIMMNHGIDHDTAERSVNPEDGQQRVINLNRPIKIDETVLTPSNENDLSYRIRAIAETETFNGEPSMSPEETASRYLLANGIKGLNYVGGTDGPSMVIFSDELLEITGYEQQKGARGKLLKYGDYEYDIQLFENADLSTFLHESGHLYLEIMKNMAKDSPAIAKDLDVILKWMGVESADQIKVEHHEKFARGIEAYFMEGKAPSAGLRAAFARFRTWLLALYRKLTSLDVKLNDEIRGTMDRMFATDAEIDAARREGQIDQIFTTAEQAGMRPEEFERYVDTIRKANLAATEELQTKLLQQYKRYQEQWWKEQRRIVRDEVRRVYNERPDVIAYNLLRLGKDPEGNELPIDQRIKLDIHVIGQMYGRDSETFRALRSMNMVRGDGGTHPNIAAELLGFKSGDHLVQAMAAIRNYKDRVETETDKLMAERYGEMLIDGTLAEQARLAVANEERAKVLHAELKALTALRNKVAPFVQEERNRQRAETTQGLATVRGVPPLETFQRLAKARIAAMAVRSIAPHQFLVAARKAGSKAVDEAAKNNFQEAAYLKQQELFNLELYREAVKARETVDDTVQFAASLTSKTARQRLGRAGDQYLEQVEALLERFDFAPTSNREADRRSRLRDWIAEQERKGIEVDIDQRIIDEARRTSYKNLTYEELQGVGDALRHIEHLAKVKNRLLKSKGKRELQAVLDDLDASIRSNRLHSKPEKTGLRLPQGEIGRFVDSFFASHRKLASYTRQFDGLKDAGTFWQYILRPINEASDNEATAIHRAGKALQKIFAPYMGATESTKSAVTVLSMGLISQGVYARTHTAAVDLSFSKMERIMVALNMGTEDNYQKLKDGYGWSDDQISAVVEPLTAQDWRFVQQIWDHLNSYWSAIEAKEKRVNGVAPPKVEARSFTTPHGDMRGGYFPLKYEDRLSPQAFGDRAKEAADMAMRGAYTRATTKRGHTKARVEGVKMPVRLDFGVIFEHVHQVIHDLSFHETLIDTNKILGSRQIQKAIIESYGDIVYKQIQDAVTDIAAGDVPASTAFEKSVTWLRHGVSVAAMGWNFATAMLQPLGLSQSVVRIGAPWVWKGISKWLGSAVKMESAVKWIHSKSEFMTNRFNTYNREINEIRNTVRGQTKLGAISETYFWMIMRAQMIADIPTWLGMYEKQMAAGVDEGTAIALADQAVLDSQGGGQIKDMAQIQRGGPLMKMWTNFYSYFSVTYNLTAESVRRTSFKDPLSVGHLAADLILLYTVPAVLGFLIKEGLRGDEEDDLVAKLAAEQAGYILGAMVGFREFSSVVQGFYGYSGPTGTRFYAEVVKTISRLQHGSDSEVSEAALKSANQAAGILFHYPAGQVQRAVEGYVAWMEGDAGPQAMLLGPPKEAR